MGCCKFPRNKLQCRHFDLEHQDVDTFVLPINIPHWLYTTWLGIWTLYFVLAFCLDGLYYREWFKESDHLWIVYLDNWGYILITCTVAMDFLITVFVKICRPEIVLGLSDECPWYLKFLWLHFNTNNSVAIVITLVLLATDALEFDHPSMNKHILNTVFVVFNVFLSAKPIRLGHVYQPMAFIISYAAFTLIFHKLGNQQAIYTYLDWSRLSSSIVACAIAIFAVTPGVHLILFSLVKCRNLLFRKSFLTTKFGSRRPSSTRVQRDLTATDVVLVEPRSNVQEIVVPPDHKDDINVHLHEGNREERDYLDQIKARMYRSESDLHDYREKNGLNCVSFETEVGLTRKDPIRHSRIIVVRTFAASSTDDELSLSGTSGNSFSSFDSTTEPAVTCQHGSNISLDNTHKSHVTDIAL